MLIVVTGAGGFIGSHVCERLLDRGYQVLGIDSLTTSYDPVLPVEVGIAGQVAAGRDGTMPAAALSVQ